MSLCKSVMVLSKFSLELYYVVYYYGFVNLYYFRECITDILCIPLASQHR